MYVNSEVGQRFPLQTALKIHDSEFLIVKTDSEFLIVKTEKLSQTIKTISDYKLSQIIKREKYENFLVDKFKIWSQKLVACFWQLACRSSGVARCVIFDKILYSA